MQLRWHTRKPAPSQSHPVIAPCGMHPRLKLIGSLLIAALALVACGDPVAPDEAAPGGSPRERSHTAAPSASLPPATPDPADGVRNRNAYVEAICPPFEAIALLDPRLAALRSAGAGGGDVTTYGPEVDLVAEELRVILNDLEAVPDWTEGSLLRNEVINALHELRSALLTAGHELDARDAADRLAAVPYISRPTLELGMQRATDAGFECSFG